MTSARRLAAAAALLLGVQALFAQSLKESVTWNSLRAHPAPLPVIGELAPVPSSLDRTSLWSVGCETLDRDYAVFDNFRQYVGETGVGYARLQSGWAKTEQKKGRYDFRWLDAQVDGLLEQGVRPWLCLCYGNPVYSKHGHDLNAKLFPDGPVMDGWLRYVKACVARYRGKVALWEVWNEPDGSRNLDSYPLYAHLFVRTAKAIREVDPEAKIAAFGSCSPDREYIRQALELIDGEGGIPLIDCITYHAYWPVPEKIVPAVRQLRADVDRYNPSIRLIQGETGCPGQLEYGHAMHDIEWNEYSQVKWDLRQMMNHFALGVPYSVFTMVDLNYGWMLQSYGLIRQNLKGVPVYKRPKFYAVQHVTGIFTPELSASDDVKASAPCELVCVGVRKGEKDIGCLLWMGGDIPSGSLDRRLVDVRLSGATFDDPVYVDLVTGYVHELDDIRDPELSLWKHPERLGGTVGFKGLPLWDAPVLIINRSALTLR